MQDILGDLDEGIAVINDVVNFMNDPIGALGCQLLGTCPTSPEVVDFRLSLNTCAAGDSPQVKSTNPILLNAAEAVNQAVLFQASSSSKMTSLLLAGSSASLELTAQADIQGASFSMAAESKVTFKDGINVLLQQGLYMLLFILCVTV